MRSADPTYNIEYAVSTLVSPRPVPVGERRLARFLGLVVATLLVVLLSLILLNSVGASHELLVVISLAWMALLCGGSPIVILLGTRDTERCQEKLRQWQRDPRRLAIERLTLELSSGRLPVGVSVGDLVNLDLAASEWRQAREGLESISWISGVAGKVREKLKSRVDEAMTNLLAEAGAGNMLGPSPFLLERARELFAEIGMEVNTVAMSHVSALTLDTDDSLEEVRASLEDFRVVQSRISSPSAPTVGAIRKSNTD